MKKIIFISILYFITLNAKAQNCLDTTVHSGTATFYTTNGIGYCGDSIKTDSMYTVALNNTMYDSSRTCGACLMVHGNLGSVVVKVEDLCSSCPANNVDLSQLAFSGIANIIDGITNIKWESVDCPVTGGIKYFFSNISNAYYIDLQIRNIRYAIKKVEFKNNGSPYVEMQRQYYNSFIISPPNSPAISPFDIRVTDILGNVIEEQVPFNVGVEIQSNFQFPLCTTTSVVDYKQNLNNIKVYPNPANGMLFIKGGCKIFKLYDITGKLVLQKNNCKQIDISDIQRGLYFYNLTTDKSMFNQKLIIK